MKKPSYESSAVATSHREDPIDWNSITTSTDMSPRISRTHELSVRSCSIVRLFGVHFGILQQGDEGRGPQLIGHSAICPSRKGCVPCCQLLRQPLNWRKLDPVQKHGQETLPRAYGVRLLEPKPSASIVPIQDFLGLIFPIHLVDDTPFPMAQGKFRLLLVFFPSKGIFVLIWRQLWWPREGIQWP
jgi:hypothetical protein